jgi:hypothetical protein
LQKITDPEDRALVEELLSIDVKTNRCNACGQTTKLLRWDFGLGKPVASARNWAGTALSVGLSALTIPLVGLGAVQLPGRSTRFRILRFQLVLCEHCYQKKHGFEAHPWWAVLRKHGYTEFLSAADLRGLT